MVFPTCFAATPCFEAHNITLVIILYTGLYNMMFVTHTVIKESAGSAGEDTPLPIYIYIYVYIHARPPPPQDLLGELRLTYCISRKHYK